MTKQAPNKELLNQYQNIQNLLRAKNAQLQDGKTPSPQTWAICDRHDTDDQLFEELCFHLFAAGFSREVVRNKWLAFRDQFDQFSIAHLVKWKAKQIERAVTNPDIIRNRKKIAAVVQNAKIIQRLQQDLGSWKQWLERYPKQELILLHREIAKVFVNVGPSAAEWFLLSSGFDYYFYTSHGHRMLRRLGLLNNEKKKQPGTTEFNAVIQGFSQATGTSTWEISVDWLRFASGFRMKESICSEETPKCIKCPLWDFCDYFNQEPRTPI